MARDLNGKVIIITGASSGIGAATAVACAQAGMKVILNARRKERLARVADQISTLNAEAHLVPGDVIEAGMTDRLLDEAANRFGRFDVVFANAGYGLEKSIVDTTEAELRRIFNVNFFSSVDLLRESASRLIEQRRPGHLLMCSSCVAKFTLPYYGLYAATKAAQNLTCRAMRLELARHNIEVASVMPISTRTEFADVVAELSLPEGEAEQIARHTPRRMIQSPQRVARAIVKCLRSPRPEVWTSLPTRFAAGLFTFFPSLGDAVMRRVQKRIEHVRSDLRSD